MKEKVWATPNRMLIETDHRTFDRQTNVISTGNVIANTQLSLYVRGELRVKCWGPETRKPGHLRDYDLRSWPEMPRLVRELVLRETKGREDSVWVSSFFHHNGSRKVVHGYIIARGNKLLHQVCTGPTYKSRLVIEGVLPYVVMT